MKIRNYCQAFALLFISSYAFSQTINPAELRMNTLCKDSFVGADAATRTRAVTDADRALGVGTVNKVDLPHFTRLPNASYFQGRAGFDFLTGRVGDYAKEDIYVTGPDDKTANYAIFARNEAEPYNDHDGAQGGTAYTAAKIPRFAKAQGDLVNGGVLCPVESIYYKPHFRDIALGDVLCVLVRSKQAVAVIQVESFCSASSGDHEGGIAMTWALQPVGENDTVFFAPTLHQTKP